MPPRRFLVGSAPRKGHSLPDEGVELRKAWIGAIVVIATLACGVALLAMQAALDANPPRDFVDHVADAKESLPAKSSGASAGICRDAGAADPIPHCLSVLVRNEDGSIAAAEGVRVDRRDVPGRIGTTVITSRVDGRAVFSQRDLDLVTAGAAADATFAITVRNRRLRGDAVTLKRDELLDRVVTLVVEAVPDAARGVGGSRRYFSSR